MSVKSKFYSLSKEEFYDYLNGLKNSPDTRFVLECTGHSYFYHPTQETHDILLELHKKQWEFDTLVNSLSEFARNQLIQSFLLDEIESTNKIENIFSTRHDIFSVMNQISTCNDKKIISITNSYSLLLGTKGHKIHTLADIRKIYDTLLTDAIEKSNLPDGVFFRKESVQISDGIKNVHMGTQGEQTINKAMEEFISLYNDKEDIFLKMIICHFVLETIHPYYDGNGRLGRFLFSNGLYLDGGSTFSFLIAKAFADNKEKYYCALKQARDPHEFGSLNKFVIDISSILISELEKATKDVAQKLEDIRNLVPLSTLSKNEQKVMSLVAEASILSNYGISNEEIIKETNISKRSLLYAIGNFRELNLLNDTKVGKTTFHKLK